MRLTTLCLILFLSITLSACQTRPAVTDDPLPEQDAQILARLQANLSDVDYGFAPLLLDPASQVTVEDGIAYLVYPTQPDNPRDWQTMDCFATAYAVRDELLTSEHVADVALGLVTLPSGLEDGLSRHVAAWVTFADGHTTIVDLTPLAAGPVGPAHTAVQWERDQDRLERQFQDWRHRIHLNKAQPMLVTRQNGHLYYLLAAVLILDDEYQFVLHDHQVQPATYDRPLQFNRSAVVGLRFDRADFANVRPMIASENAATAFSTRPHLLTRQGDTDPTLNAVLDEHLYLLWHLVTKFSHGDPLWGQEPELSTLIVPEGGKVRITLEPVRGTPEPDPTLTLHVNLVDGQTGQPVQGDVLLGDEDCRGEIVQRQVSQFAVALPGRVETTPIYLCVLAEGYERWSQGYRYHLEHSRGASFTVELTRE
jgi:hypothetical protein